MTISPLNLSNSFSPAYVSSPTDTRSIVIQSPCTRRLSLASLINDKGAEVGLESFFSEKIPFDSVTNASVAAQLAGCINLLAQQHPVDKCLHIYEFGAGLGLLARNLLDRLQEAYPKLYARITLHISDISEKKLYDLKTLAVFDAHRKKILFSVVDLADPHYNEGCEPLLVYHSYLFAALPVRHIVYTSGEICEALVQTHISEEAEVASIDMDQQSDLSVFRHKIWKGNKLADKLMENCESGHLDMHPDFYRQVRPKLEESLVLKNIEELDISIEEQKALVEYVDLIKPCDNVVFNFHYDVLKSTEKVMTSLPEGSAYLAIDTGQNTPIQADNVEDLLSQYGLYTYYPFSFSTLLGISSQGNYHYRSKEPFGDSFGNTLGLLYKSNRVQESSQVTMLDHMESIFQSGSADYYKSLRKLLISAVDQQELQQLENDSPQDKRTYTLYMYLGRAARMKGFHDYAQRCFSKAGQLTFGASMTASLMEAFSLADHGHTYDALRLMLALFNKGCCDAELFRYLLDHYHSALNTAAYLAVLKRYLACGYKAQAYDNINRAIHLCLKDNMFVQAKALIQ